MAVIQGIALAAAEGDVDARNQLIRIMHDGHMMLQPAPHEAKQGSQGPIRSQFERYKPPTDQPSPSESIAPAFEAPRSVRGPRGGEYVIPTLAR